MMKFLVLALSCLCASTFARPNDLSGLAHGAGGQVHNHGATSGYNYNGNSAATLEGGAVAASHGNGEPSAPVAVAEPAVEVVKIIKDERDHKEDGSYTFDIETEDGVIRTESGTVGENGGINQQGRVAFTFPTGEAYEMSFEADDGGFKPESSWIPVAPEFPHPIPEFVLEQIEKAKEEDASGTADQSGQYDSSQDTQGQYDSSLNAEGQYDSSQDTQEAQVAGGVQEEVQLPAVGQVQEVQLPAVGQVQEFQQQVGGQVQEVQQHGGGQGAPQPQVGSSPYYLGK